MLYSIWNMRSSRITNLLYIGFTVGGFIYVLVLLHLFFRPIQPDESFEAIRKSVEWKEGIGSDAYRNLLENENGFMIETVESERVYRFGRYVVYPNQQKYQYTSQAGYVRLSGNFEWSFIRNWKAHTFVSIPTVKS